MRGVFFFGQFFELDVGVSSRNVPCMVEDDVFWALSRNKVNAALLGLEACCPVEAIFNQATVPYFSA